MFLFITNINIPFVYIFFPLITNNNHLQTYNNTYKLKQTEIKMLVKMENFLINRPFPSKHLETLVKEVSLLKRKTTLQSASLFYCVWQSVII